MLSPPGLVPSANPGRNRSSSSLWSIRRLWEGTTTAGTPRGRSRWRSPGASPPTAATPSRSGKYQNLIHRPFRCLFSLFVCQRASIHIPIHNPYLLCGSPADLPSVFVPSSESWNLNSARSREVLSVKTNVAQMRGGAAASRPLERAPEFEKSLPSCEGSANTSPNGTHILIIGFCHPQTHLDFGVDLTVWRFEAQILYIFVA